MERKSGIIEVRGEEYSIKELTVAQIEKLTSEYGDGTYKPHILDGLIGEQHSLLSNMFFAAINKKPEEFNLDLSPSEIDAIYKKVVEVNPFCVAAVKRILDSVATRPQRSGGPPSSS